VTDNDDNICKTENLFAIAQSERLRKVVDDIKSRIETLKDWNPYPADVFLPKSDEQWKAFHEALDKAGLKGDGFLGCVSRDAYNLALDRLLEQLEEENQTNVKNGNEHKRERCIKGNPKSVTKKMQKQVIK